MAELNQGRSRQASSSMPTAWQRKPLNAFLKTLEEPPDGSLLLLLTEYPEQLLDTVRSRCIRVALAPEPGTTRKFTASQKELLDALATHFSGELSISRALSLMKQFVRLLAGIKAQIAEELEKESKAESAHYKQTTEGDWLKRREDHFKALAEARYLQQRERPTRAAVALVRRHAAPTGAMVLTSTSPPTNRQSRQRPGASHRRNCYRRLEAAESLRRHLQTNVSEPLALEVAFLDAFGPLAE